MEKKCKKIMEYQAQNYKNKSIDNNKSWKLITFNKKKAKKMKKI